MNMQNSETVITAGRNYSKKPIPQPVSKDVCTRPGSARHDFMRQASSSKRTEQPTSR